jgi:hypothetical protein
MASFLAGLVDNVIPKRGMLIQMVPGHQLSLPMIYARYVTIPNLSDRTDINYSRQNSIFFVGDIAAYNKNNDTPASPVVRNITAQPI